MRALPGRLAKSGAEGLLCLAGPDGTGLALKTEDDSSRPHRPLLAAFLRLLRRDLPGWDRVPLENSRGEAVGELSTAS